MTDEPGIKKPVPEEVVATQLVPAEGLTSGDEIELADGQTVVVRDVALYSRDRSMRGRKLPNCRIRVTIPNKSGSSGGSVTAAQGDLFTKLVGVSKR